MKINKGGFTLVSVIFAVVGMVIALGIGVGVRYFTDGENGVVSQADSYVSQDLSTPSTQPINQTLPINNAPESIVDCGVAGGVTFFGSGSNQTIEATDDTIKAWECFTDSIYDCSPAKLHVQSNQNEMDYAVLKRENDSCVISGPKMNFQDDSITPVTCQISKKYIDFSYTQADQKHPSKKFFEGFATVGVITAGGGNVPYPDGTSEQIVCR